MPKDTPAQRAAARRDPAIRLPPKPPESDRRSALRRLHLLVAGVAFLIGPSIEGDPQIAATADGTETVTMAVRDQAGSLADALGDEEQLLTSAARVTIDGTVYALQSANVDTATGTLVTLVFEDEVSWRLKQFSRFLAISRAHATRGQAVLRLVKEASAPPLAPIYYFIPELTDPQRIALPTSDTTSSTAKGTGAQTGYRVKHQRANATQRDSIDAVLSEAQSEGASRRVMIAAIMTPTQESALDPAETNGDHVGLYQQDPGWGSELARRDRKKSTRAFLAAWKKEHGSVKHAPGDLAGAIEAVQRSGQGSLYAQWEDEATATVDRWRADSGGSSGRTVVQPFEFSRGEKDGQRETSWDATGRWASDVNFRRWAQRNTLFFVSDEELRAAAPALEVHGDESWLLSPPGGDWSPDRPENEVTMRVLADRWGVQIGARVLVATGRVGQQGSYLVEQTDGYMVNPELTVTLRRPATKKPEPPHDVQQASSSSGGSSDLVDACSTISKQNHPYVYGGGHKKLSSITAHEGLDCSSSCSLALHKAGMFKGSVAISSGDFASSYGKPGKGREFTVWANATHVWIELHGDGRYKRFDTSPHGSGASGPHLRETGRTDQARFTARHWPGH